MGRDHFKSSENYQQKDIAKPIPVIPKQCMKCAIFHEKLKLAKVTPAHKKRNDQLFGNYRSVASLPVFS